MIENIESSETYYAPPSSFSLLQSMRSMGYSPETAIADLVDNSITAEADSININFSWKGKDSFISIGDNGHGMNHSELLNAMKIGLINPLTVRNENDLGRFGMGLKTASISQCKSLTVISKRKDCSPVCLRWDLDFLKEYSEKKNQNDWVILSTPGEEAKIFINKIKAQEQGTYVVWEKLDRFCSQNFDEQFFLDEIDKIEKHIGLIFHRFLSSKKKPIQIFINGRKVKPIDPFMITNSFTQSSPIERIKTKFGYISIQAHILPFVDNLTEDEIEKISWNDDMANHQGFYIYRNDRLLVSGSWLGLGELRPWTKEEAYKLARISIDLTNTTDELWQIDIMKSKATPPSLLRNKLIQIGKIARKKSRQTFAYRGSERHSLKEMYCPIWVTRQNRQGQTDYKINREHPLVKELIAMNSKDIHLLLSTIESCVPVRQIWIESAEGKELPDIDRSEEKINEIKEMLSSAIDFYTESGSDMEDVYSYLSSMEPFCNYPEIVNSMFGR